MWIDRFANTALCGMCGTYIHVNVSVIMCTNVLSVSSMIDVGPASRREKIAVNRHSRSLPHSPLFTLCSSREVYKSFITPQKEDQLSLSLGHGGGTVQLHETFSELRFLGFAVLSVTSASPFLSLPSLYNLIFSKMRHQLRISPYFCFSIFFFCV